MSAPFLEEVFKTSGVPTFTFVEPSEYTRLIVGLRTPGRGVVIEGPSGIGKTTAVETALKLLRVSDATTKLSARRPADVEVELSPKLRQTVKAHFSLNGELSHGSSATEVHERV